MSWVESALESASEPITLDISHLGLKSDGEPVLTLEMLPLSMKEYQILKADPDIRNLTGRDRDEMLGVKMSFEMLKKCDASLNWGQFQSLPIATLTAIAVATAEAMGTGADSGALGN